MTAGAGRPAYRWALAGAIAAIVLALLTATALSYADGDGPEAHVEDLSAPVVSMLWRVQTGKPVTGSPAVLADRIVLGGADGTIRAFALADGSPRWTFYAASGHAVYTRVADRGWHRRPTDRRCGHRPAEVACR